MSTIIEDPEIPLVGMNGHYQSYTEEDEDPLKNPKPRKKSKYENVGLRLARRKELFARRRTVSDVALAFAMLGICLMIVETELNMAGVYDKSSIASIVVKLFITISTVDLLGFIVWYHIIDIKLFMIDNGMDDWRLAMYSSRVLKITLELLICGIHPLPGKHEFEWTTVNAHSQKISVNHVSWDIIFSIPMFLRLYLVCRVLLLHSRLFADARSQSLGALNRISFNFSFIFKSLMNLYPEYVLTIITITFFMISSWCLRACEMHHDTVHRNFFNSMWVIAITFLSVGYGDIVPNSYCGRGIAVLTGMFGAGITALLVAVLAQKLEFSRAEKCVHNFVLDVDLDKRHKHAAANILREGWIIYKYKKLKRPEGSIRNHQRKLLKAIRDIREVKGEQRKLLDSGINLIEMAKAQSVISEKMEEMDERQTGLEESVNHMKDVLTAIDTKLDNLGHLMSRLDRS